MNSFEFQNMVVESLKDSNFDPKEHEAYAFCVDYFLGEMPRSRIKDFMMSALAEVDWEQVEQIVSM